MLCAFSVKMRGAMKYTLIDLAKIKAEMGQHWNANERESVTGRCSQCNEEIKQTRSTCIVCGTPVVWRGSRVWKRLYGGPSLAESKLLRTPTDTAGIELCKHANVASFPTPRLLTRWEEAVEQLDSSDTDGIVAWCTDTMKTRGRGMRGLVQFAVNTVEKRARGKDAPDVGDWDAVEYGGHDE